MQTRYFNNHKPIAEYRRALLLQLVIDSLGYNTIIYVGGMYKREKPISEVTIYINPDISANDTWNNNEIKRLYINGVY